MISLKDDPLVRVDKHGILFEPMYYRAKISDDPHCWLRLRILERLLETEEKLPQGHFFKVWDGYRKTSVQKRLYDDLYKKLVQKNPGWSEDKLHTAVQEFVAPPTTDPERAAPHNTGAAIDLTIVDSDGKELDMGTVFDHFEEEAHTLYYKNSSPNTLEASHHTNRMILYKVLTDAGFYNEPDEWWHYSYGDVRWSDHYGKEILYPSAESDIFELSIAK